MPRIQHKRGTSANLASVNPTPLAGELVWDSTENAIKIGDGATAWTSLAYVTATPRSHTHTMANISDISVEPAGSPPRTWDVALTFNYATSSWVAKGIGNVGIGSQPLGGWPSGSVGAELAGKAPAASPAITGNATFEASSGVPVTITNTGTGNSFVVNDAAGDTTPFVVDASGRVGIGATTALGPLHVATVSNTDVYLQCADTAQSRINFGGVTDPDAGRIAYSDNVDAFLIFTDNAERIRITSTGSVGIGTTSPSSLLHVNGVITVSAGTAAAPALVASGDPNTGVLFPAADTFAISTAGSERVRVRADGNVGVGYSGAATHRFGISGNISGTGSNLIYVAAGTAQSAVTSLYGVWCEPSVAADCSLTVMAHYHATQGTVSGAVATQYGFLCSSTLTGATNNYGFYSNIASATGRWNFFANGTADNYFAGNVGIGSGRTSPATALDVNGVITVSATSGSAGSYLPSLTFSGDANTGFGQVSGQSDTASVFTAGHERVRVKSTGAVRCVPLTGTDPTGEVGDIYYNSTMGTLRTYRGSSWVSVPPRPWDISNGVLTHEFSVAGQETQPTGIAFKPDGSKMYIVGQIGDDVNEYDLATPWDISTATYLQAFSVSGKETGPTAVYFRPTGLKMYVLGVSSDSVHEYDLSTAWDVSTATFLQSFSVSAKEGSPHGLVFKPDGLKFWICGVVSDSVHEYSLSTAWDISTATFAQSLSVSAQDTQSSGLAFRPDGLRMYMTGYTTDTTNEYILSTAWDISTAAFSQRLSIADLVPAGTTFSPDGTRLYVVGYNGQKILQYWIA